MKPLYVCFAILVSGCTGMEPPVEATDPPVYHLPGAPAAAGGSDGGVDTANPDLAEPAPPPAPPPPAPSKKVLTFAWQGENKYYFCGPSAARMALSTRMASPPTQDTLGSYMGTTSNGTDDISLVRGALDHYLNISSYGTTYLPNDPPSQAQKDALKQHIVASIDAGYGMVANIVAGWRPPFYPQGGTIYHYVAVVGYDAGGDKVLIADPAATGCGDGACGSPSSGYYNVPKSYWINTTDLAVWIAPKGYTWHP